MMTEYASWVGALYGLAALIGDPRAILFPISLLVGAAAGLWLRRRP